MCYVARAGPGEVQSAAVNCGEPAGAGVERRTPGVERAAVARSSRISATTSSACSGLATH
jgi:hypothetical protein